ncbi:hypothetical protein MA16_Dca010543 [Dendrobium catenatum]|uniref:DUF4283 domain-containing protein n=1 Tax=Dendrobium catenatum TaxID=906689 RepID=A0A2I0XF14_9ASPA|nr:hypothetical protein MA16_Dca010543 [Dendrobium catenatum]
MSTITRPSVMRFLIELDITKHYPDKVWGCPEGLGYIQSVIFDEFPPYCPHCKSLGHSKLKCDILHPHSIPNAKVVNVVLGVSLVMFRLTILVALALRLWLIRPYLCRWTLFLRMMLIGHISMDVVVIDSSLVLGEDVPGVDLDLDQDLGPTNAFVGNDCDLVNMMDVNVHGSDNLDMVKANLDGKEVIVA